MKKRLFCVLLTMLLLCLATGCDNNKEKTPGDFAGSSSSPSPSPSPSPSVSPSPAPTPSPTPSFEPEESGVIDDIGDTAGEVIDDAGDGVKDIIDGVEDVADDLTGTRKRPR